MASQGELRVRIHREAVERAASYKGSDPDIAAVYEALARPVLILLPAKLRRQLAAEALAAIKKKWRPRP